MISILLIALSCIFAWLTWVSVRVVAYKPQTKYAVGTVNKVCDNGSFVYYYIRFIEDNNEYIGESEPYHNHPTNKKYKKGDKVGIEYYFADAGPKLVIQDKSLKKLKMSLLVPVFSGFLSAIFFVVFVYRIVLCFI